MMRWYEAEWYRFAGFGDHTQPQHVLEDAIMSEFAPRQSRSVSQTATLDRNAPSESEPAYISASSASEVRERIDRTDDETDRDREVPERIERTDEETDRDLVHLVSRHALRRLAGRYSMACARLTVALQAPDFFLRNRCPTMGNCLLPPTPPSHGFQRLHGCIWRSFSTRGSRLSASHIR
eukprot:5605587-Pyramimonas_sp.AAC.1